jgi:hypothetical protein
VTAVATRQVARREHLDSAVAAARAEAPPGAVLWLVGDTSHLWEGWLERAPALHCATGEPAARAALATACARLDVSLILESPADVIPLPAGSEARHRPVAGTAGLLHFDPYSVAFRCLARGDEPDYRTVLRYLRHGWMTLEDMDRLLDHVLPRFTRETIAQDPAEFRRKYRGLTQMWRAERHPERRHTGTAG